MRNMVEPSRLATMVDEEHFVTNQGFVNLTIGAPGPKTLSASRKLFREAANIRLSSDNDDKDTPLFQYGTEEGPTTFIKQLSLLLSDGYNDSVDPKNLMLTSGASMGFFLATAMLLSKDKSTVIFVESPTYFLVLNMIRDHGFQNIIPVKMTNDGVDIAMLEYAIKKQFEKRNNKDNCDTTGKFWAMFYTIPTYHNPTGVCLSDSKSKKVIQIARKYNVLVVCDDVYNLLYYSDDDNVPKRLVSYDKKEDEDFGGGHVLSNGSFSKILAPGVRIGWIESSVEIIQKIISCGMIVSGGSLNPVTSGILAAGIECGLQMKHIKHLREEYGRRMSAACEIFKDNLPDGFECKNPGGGYFLWVTGPLDSFDSSKFADYCLGKYKVKVLPGHRCSSVSKDDIKNVEMKELLCTNAFRISIAYYEHEELCQAIRKVCEACRDIGL